jgi:hypothetical protein
MTFYFNIVWRCFNRAGSVYFGVVKSVRGGRLSETSQHHSNIESIEDMKSRFFLTATYQNSTTLSVYLTLPVGQTLIEVNTTD